MSRGAEPSRGASRKRHFLEEEEEEQEKEEGQARTNCEGSRGGGGRELALEAQPSGA